MIRTRRFSAASALLAAAMAMPVAGWAQTQEGPSAANTPAPGNTTSQQAAAPAPRSAKSADLLRGVEQHIQVLHRQLHITAAQEPQWKQFADVMRGNAQAMSDSLDQRAQQIATMDAVQDMASYAQLATERSQDLVKLSSAFATLYGTFSDQQKKDADALFRRQAEVHADKRGDKHAS
jgi:hypothetical protein